MSAEEGQRKIAAILAADVAGYSRLMSDDERATVRTLTEYRDIFTGLVEARQGRIVDTAGDSVLATFDSVVEAVEAAVEVQRELAERNEKLPDHRRMHFRIGVNLGDIIVRDDGTIYGDGVNVAARLEGLAEPDGVVVSDDAYRQVRDKLDVGFADLGDHEVKNIARPVRAYRVDTATEASSAETEAPELPSRPSIAVLPFQNMSGDPEQDYFADGIAEDLITGLSRLRWLFVVARNSTFTYKGQAVDIKQVGRELGVRYVVEGSVRRGGNRVRISVQLIDATTGNHVWAERYDRALDDLFAVQDEITETVVATIEPEISAVERDRARRKPPAGLDAWEAYQRGMWHVYQFTEEDNLAARQLFRQAIKFDPEFAAACAALSYAHMLGKLLGFSGSDLNLSLEMGLQAVRLDGRDAITHYALGRALTEFGRHDDAVGELQIAVSLNPSLAAAHYGLGWAYYMSDRFEESVSALALAERFSPRDPIRWAVESVRAQSLFFIGDNDAALAEARKAARHANAGLWAHVILAATLGKSGNMPEARSALDVAHSIHPGFSAATIRELLDFSNPDRAEQLIAVLKEIGLPDGA
jgi:adenylate cyclase